MLMVILDLVLEPWYICIYTCVLGGRKECCVVWSMEYGGVGAPSAIFWKYHDLKKLRK